MPKPTPNCIRFSLGEGYISVEGDYLVFAGTQKPGSSDAQCIVIEDPATTAAVLLELAKTLLQRTDPESSKKVFLEAGFLEREFLESNSNDLRFTRVNKENNLQANNAHAAQQGKLGLEVREELVSGQIPEDTIRYFESKGGFIRVLNNSVNPVKAARTMMAKPKFEGQYQGWLKNNSAPAPIPASFKVDAVSVEEETFSILCRNCALRPIEDIEGPYPTLCTECIDEYELKNICPACKKPYPCPCPEPGDEDGLEA